MTLHDLLESAVAHGAADLLLKAGARPAFRVHGRLRFLSCPPLTPQFTAEAMRQVASERQREAFERDGEVDLAYEQADAGRFRVNVYRQRGFVSLAFRHVRYDVPTLQELSLPHDTLAKLCTSPRGLVLVTGVTGSGKSTTLAAMIDHLNRTLSKHVVTVEDPIEFIYEDKKCLIEQRELGEDTQTFTAALKHVVRQAPDVILIGEMRDQATVHAALGAAETGHLVLSTLHTVNASQTVERLISFFPPHQHDEVRLQLSMIFVGAVSQRLVPKADGKGLVPAVEVMTASPRVRELINEGATRDLGKVIRDGRFYGMQTFNQSLLGWLERKAIKLEDAMLASDDPDELRLELDGVTKAGGPSEIVLE